jgi:hypothetical protein
LRFTVQNDRVHADALRIRTNEPADATCLGLGACG